jgi:hypothetical protein
MAELVVGHVSHTWRVSAFSPSRTSLAPSTLGGGRFACSAAPRWATPASSSTREGRRGRVAAMPCCDGDVGITVSVKKYCISGVGQVRPASGGPGAPRFGWPQRAGRSVRVFIFEKNGYGRLRRDIRNTALERPLDRGAWPCGVWRVAVGVRGDWGVWSVPWPHGHGRVCPRSVLCAQSVACVSVVSVVCTQSVQ